MTDTIFALSSGRPPAGIAVIRVSGPAAFDAAEAMAGPLPAMRHARLRAFRDPATGDLLDRGVLLVAQGPGTATGENIVEFQCHGGKATIESILAALARQEGLRMAEPGEFTRQALANGILDLSEAEGLADLLSAETELQRKVALGRSEGSLRRAVEEIREALLGLAAAVELAIDYVDEDEDADMRLPPDAFGAIAQGIDSLLAQPSVERLRDGVRVVVAGPPNAGKSSLINVLAQEERAIVTPVAGTTRDTIEVPLSLDGLPVVLVDTAGLRETDEEVERIGIARAERALAAADIVLWLGDPQESPPGAVLVASKADINPASRGIPFSALSGLGHKQVLEAIAARAETLLPVPAGIALSDRERNALEVVLAAVHEARDGRALEIQAEYLRRGREALDKLTGRAGVEELLDTLFSRFCVGK